MAVVDVSVLDAAEVWGQKIWQFWFGISWYGTAKDYHWFAFITDGLNFIQVRHDPSACVITCANSNVLPKTKCQHINFSYAS